MSTKCSGKTRKTRPEGPCVHDEPDPPRDASGQLLMFTNPLPFPKRFKCCRCGGTIYVTWFNSPAGPLCATCQETDSLENDIRTTLGVDEEEGV
jgi:hypothetical protein